MCKEYDEMTMEDYKGSLNKSLTKDVLEYITPAKGIFGYLGSTARTHRHDETIEQIFENIIVTLDNKSLDKWKALGSWLTSTDARHFMDSIEDESIEVFKQKIKEYSFNIIIQGFIYDLPEHKGTWGSTIRLQKIYKDRIKLQEVGA